jgi:hypothetical protein
MGDPRTTSQFSNWASHLGGILTQPLDDEHADALGQGKDDEVVIPPESGSGYEASGETQGHNQDRQERKNRVDDEMYLDDGQHRELNVVEHGVIVLLACADRPTLSTVADYSYDSKKSNPNRPMLDRTACWRIHEAETGGGDRNESVGKAVDMYSHGVPRGFSSRRHRYGSIDNWLLYHHGASGAEGHIKEHF